ncbi:DUF5707 domain-containing protein [Streptomyces sp. NPDC017202]|uniref:DUF5707 domain-containing protein n=1 Tax=Streptomyces sp. NPDC017202 TaxID=3364981 RepID=UPI0037A82F3E
MSQRVAVPSLIGVAVLGAVAAGGPAVASTAAEPALEGGSAHHVAPSGGSAGSLALAADVRDDSGVRGLKVLAWPARSKLGPAEAELRHADDATCRGISDGTSRCTYALKVTRQEAAGLERGAWYVPVPAVAEDGDTVFLPRAAAFDVGR